jgi:cell division protein FtsI (penicillin-binding protein 3)
MMKRDTSIARDPQAGQKEFSGRFFLLKLGFVLFFLLIAARLVKIQIADAGRYQTIARKQYEQRFILPASRGNIYDRNGNILASNTMLVSFAADPKMLGNNASAVAETFARVFEKPTSHYLNKLHARRGTSNAKRFVWLERHAKPELTRRLDSARLDGIVVIDEPKRLYHYDELAGPLLGFTDVDNQGISGLELQFDQEMDGVDGSVVMQRDGLGRARPTADYPKIDPVNGNDIRLTIDLTFQAIVEEELKRGIDINNADAGIAVMLNPKTGEILALANVPGVNPNRPSKYDPSTTKNRVVTDMFEPGSVFKVVTAAVAYEKDIISPHRRFDAEGGEWRVPLPGGNFRLIKDTKPHNVITFQEAIEVSSNVVVAKAAPIIGPEPLFRQARDFGFGILTGVDLPGEVRGRLKKPHEWSGTTLQTLSYGYEVGVTPLQLATAYAAVANKGILMKPFIVAEIRDPNGDVLRTAKPQSIRRVVSEETARLLTEAFEGVVERGTAKEVRIQGMRIAGKTGTSRKIVDGKYSTQQYTSSFVGYFPADDPEIVCLVMLDNPRARGYYGGVTSGPVFRAIAERIINTTTRFPRTPRALQARNRENGVAVPDVRTLQVGIAKKILEGHGLRAEVFGEGEIVVRQSPDQGTRVDAGDAVSLVLAGESVADEHGQLSVPDLRGMSIRRAINRLIADEFEIRIVGSGLVSQQTPAPGEKTFAGSVVTIVCEPRRIVSTVLY